MHDVPRIHVQWNAAGEPRLFHDHPGSPLAADPVVNLDDPTAGWVMLVARADDWRCPECGGVEWVVPSRSQ